MGLASLAPYRCLSAVFASLTLFPGYPFGMLYTCYLATYLLASSLWSLQICYASRLPFGSLCSALTRKFCKPSVLDARRHSGRKEVVHTGVYTIIRVYEVPAETQQQATDRMLEAIVLHVEKDFHVKDILREPGSKPGQGKEVKLAPPAGWMTLAIRQLTGRKA